MRVQSQEDFGKKKGQDFFGKPEMYQKGEVKGGFRGLPLNFTK